MANQIVQNAINKTIQALYERKFEAAGGTLFFLWENIEGEVCLPSEKPAIELINKATALVINEDPYSDPKLNAYNLDENELAEAIGYLMSALQCFS